MSKDGDYAGVYKAMAQPSFPSSLSFSFVLFSAEIWNGLNKREKKEKMADWHEIARNQSE